ncbi:MAG: DUF368 domain-containing protein, partial [Gammaproteobacteria bacterium]|nr:DUF368 domain-containing protein [Gammaproteobacteria bacterium]
MARRGIDEWLGLLFRGIAMGIAEVVPGVSGGTIAFITGIYHELVNTLAGFGINSVRGLIRRGPLAFWREQNLSFLSVLLVGMLLSVLAFARVIGYWLEVVPTLVWGFFSGLIVASVVQIGRQRRVGLLLGFGALGCAAGIALTSLDPLQLHDALWVYFVGGLIAISAWMLPAISGSFMLLILGLYHPVIAALNGWQWPVLTSLALGCVVGMLVFSKLLAWLMEHRREPVLALLTGFMAGSV